MTHEEIAEVVDIVINDQLSHIMAILHQVVRQQQEQTKALQELQRTVNTKETELMRIATVVIDGVLFVTPQGHADFINEMCKDKPLTIDDAYALGLRRLCRVADGQQEGIKR